MTDTLEQLRQFTLNAENVSAHVTQVKDLAAAFQYAVETCVEKEACQMLPSGCDAPLSPEGEASCATKSGKIVAAPGFDTQEGDLLNALCSEKGIDLIYKGLRGHLGGIDIGITWVDYGIADTGTLVIDSTDEEIRLASMLSEIHIGFLPVSRICGSSFELESVLTEWMSRPNNYTAWVTGASRTADIERVLTLGVHGPLALHIVLLEDQ